MTISAPIHTDEHSIDRVLGAGLPVLLVFWRRECPPCEALEPALRQLASANAGALLVAKVDARENPGLLRRFDVSRLPELVALRGGAEVARAQGAAEPAALRGWVEALLRGASAPAPSGPSIPLGGAPARQPVPQPASNGHHDPGRAPRPAPAPGGPVTLTDATFDQVVGRAEAPVLVDFWAPWCGPCRAVAPTVERLAQEFAGRAVVAKLNVDENPRTAQRFGITGIPALYIFKGGQVVDRLMGAQPASALRQALARHAGQP